MIFHHTVDLSSWEVKIEEDQDVDHHDNSFGEELEGEATAEDHNCSYQEHDRYKEGVLTIGCIGKCVFYILHLNLRVLFCSKH